MSERIGLAEALMVLDGFRVLEVTRSIEELVIGIGTEACFPLQPVRFTSNATGRNLATPSTD